MARKSVKKSKKKVLNTDAESEIKEIESQIDKFENDDQAKKFEEAEARIKKLEEKINQQNQAQPEFMDEVTKVRLVTININGQSVKVALRPSDSNIMVLYLALISLNNPQVNNLLINLEVRLSDYQNKVFWPPNLAQSQQAPLVQNQDQNKNQSNKDN